MTGEGLFTRNSCAAPRAGWRGWVFVAVMLAVLAAMDWVLLPAHPGLAMAGAGAWAAVTVVVGLVESTGVLRLRDILRSAR